MKKFIIKSSIFLMNVFLWLNCFSQSRSFSDPAQMYNRLVLEKGSEIVRIGNFKVKGTPYMYAGNIKGDLYVKGSGSNTVFISYNTYNQTIDYNTTGQTSGCLQPEGIVDSFKLFEKPDIQLNDDVWFINSNLINSSEKGFYQRLYEGPAYSLFKFYKSTLGIVSTNYVQPDLRQFDLNYEYYYLDQKQKKLKKIKANLSSVKKEFSGLYNTSEFTNDNFTYELEATLVRLFTAVNK